MMRSPGTLHLRRTTIGGPLLLIWTWSGAFGLQRRTKTIITSSPCRRIETGRGDVNPGARSGWVTY